jgi:hypothetical protein
MFSFMNYHYSATIRIILYYYYYYYLYSEMMNGSQCTYRYIEVLR